MSDKFKILTDECIMSSIIRFNLKLLFLAIAAGTVMHIAGRGMDYSLVDIDVIVQSVSYISSVTFYSLACVLLLATPVTVAVVLSIKYAVMKSKMFFVSLGLLIIMVGTVTVKIIL